MTHVQLLKEKRKEIDVKGAELAALVNELEKEEGRSFKLFDSEGEHHGNLSAGPVCISIGDGLHSITLPHDAVEHLLFTLCEMGFKPKEQPPQSVAQPECPHGHKFKKDCEVCFLDPGQEPSKKKRR